MSASGRSGSFVRAWRLSQARSLASPAVRGSVIVHTPASLSPPSPSDQQRQHRLPAALRAEEHALRAYDAQVGALVTTGTHAGVTLHRRVFHVPLPPPTCSRVSLGNTVGPRH